MTINIETQILELEFDTLDQLRSKYRYYFKKEPASYENGPMLKRKIADKIQRLAFGGLNKRTIEHINCLINKNTNSKSIRSTNLRPGTVIPKQWHGCMYYVTVTEDGFVYNNIHFNSLSAVARSITGTNWNGNRFFNLI